MLIERIRRRLWPNACKAGGEATYTTELCRKAALEVAGWLEERHPEAARAVRAEAEGVPRVPARNNYFISPRRAAK